MEANGEVARRLNQILRSQTCANGFFRRSYTFKSLILMKITAQKYMELAVFRGVFELQAAAENFLEVERP